jgi:very-short-patch-repair endonuclease
MTRRQGGLVARRQLSAIDVGPREVDALLRSGRLEATRGTGVYRAGGAPHTPETPAWLAVLGTDSPLSYLSAAEWWEIEVPLDGWVHVTRLGRRRLDWPSGVRVHRVGLDPTAVTTRFGLVLTTRVETVLDCMGWLSLGSARALGDRAVQQRWISEADVLRRLDEQPGRWGNRQLRRLLPGLADGADAESERLLHRLLRAAGIEGWVPNLPFVAGGERYVIDVAFPELRLAIEIDGYRYHRAGARFQRDRTKQNALVRAGWTVLRFTWADLDDRPDTVLREIVQLLAA